MSDLSGRLRGHKNDWYQAEKNTAALLSVIAEDNPLKSLSGDCIWHLLRLTWITRARSHDFWKELKVPALAHLWGRKVDIRGDLKATLDAMSLPPAVAAAAIKETGIVNAYNKWRNSSRAWCRNNQEDLLRIVRAAAILGRNDEARMALANKIENLPSVRPPSGAFGNASPAGLLTPLVACLDPYQRFPLINGRKAVRRLLAKLGLANRSLNEQVRGMLGLIGKNGISDSFLLDVLASDAVGMAQGLCKIQVRDAGLEEGSPLPDFDTEERQAVRKSKTTRYRQRHNKMTRALKRICTRWKLKRGTMPHCCFDVLVENYEGTGRNLLLELKPDPDRGSLRIAIGQLLDYRRFLPHQAGTDLGILSISPPEKTYRTLLLDLQISPIWFQDETCQELGGEGEVWKAWRAKLSI